MNTVKRVEIVIDQPHEEAVRRVLEAEGVEGWTLIRDVHGHGGRGERSGDDLTGVFSNCYILTTCPPGQLAGLTDALRPVLERYGGLVLVSDALSLKH